MNFAEADPVKVAKRLPKALQKTHWDSLRPVLNTTKALAGGGLRRGTQKTMFFNDVLYRIDVFTSYEDLAWTPKPTGKVSSSVPGASSRRLEIVFESVTL